MRVFTVWLALVCALVSCTAQEYDEELVDVVMEPSGKEINMRFTSHGRKHKFNLREGKNQFANMEINLVGMPQLEQDAFKDHVKDLRLMKDSKYGAMVAVRYGADGTGPPMLQSGVYKLGDDEFEMSHHSGDKARVKKRQVSEEEVPIVTGIPAPNQGYAQAQAQMMVEGEATPIDATVEMVYIVDYSNWVKFNADAIRADGALNHTSHLLLYFAHMAEAVDVIYSNIDNPSLSVQVVLNGIVVLTAADVHPVLVENYKEIDEEGHVTIDTVEMLFRLRDWLATSDSDFLPKFDYIQMFTNYDLSYYGNDLSLGIGYIGGLCDATHAISVIENTPPHSSVSHLSASQLGHGLGSASDGFGTGAGCPEENYLMSGYIGLTSDPQNMRHLSCCSQRSIYGFLRLKSCLDGMTGPHELPQYLIDSVDTKLPGEIYDADDQCQMSYGTDACGDSIYDNVGVGICERLYCNHPTDPSLCNTRNFGADDGTPCDVGKWCYQGVCVNTGDKPAPLPTPSCDVNSCFENELRCGKGTNVVNPGYHKCFPAATQCDGRDDCSNRLDERDKARVKAKCNNIRIGCKRGRKFKKNLYHQRRCTKACAKYRKRCCETCTEFFPIG